MLCAGKRLTAADKCRVVQSKRGFQKKKITLKEVSAALEIKKKQKKTFLETYYSKWGKKKDQQIPSGKIVEQEAQREAVEAQSGEKTKKLTPKSKVDSKKLHGQIMRWITNKRRDHIKSIGDATELVMTTAAREKARKLHIQEPHYWTPNRLASFFKTSVEKMRGYLYEGKLLQELRDRGFEIDEEHLQIDDLFGKIFGSVDYPDDYFDTPDEIPIRKIHNPWYFVDPGVKSGNLLKFLRSKETRHYKEASRIPTQPYPKMQIYKEVLGKGIKPKPTPPHKKARCIYFDSSERFHMYDRPILVRDHDNTWRECTWEERRFIENSRRQIKYPYHQPFQPDFDHQPDWIKVAHKPPSSFDVAWGNENYFDDVFTSGKSLLNNRKVLSEMQEAGFNTDGMNAVSFEKQLKDVEEASKYIDYDLRRSGQSGLADMGDEDERDQAEEQQTKLKNERFARTLSSYRVQYDYE
jgi:hypothetical protein